LDRGIAYPLAECTTMLIGGSGAIESVHAWVIEPQIPPPWNVLGRFDEEFVSAAELAPATDQNLKAVA
jgi:hypothetical protein